MQKEPKVVQQAAAAVHVVEVQGAAVSVVGRDDAWHGHFALEKEEQQARLALGKISQAAE